jgi:hypothetical protein
LCLKLGKLGNILLDYTKYIRINEIKIPKSTLI